MVDWVILILTFCDPAKHATLTSLYCLTMAISYWEP